MAVCPTCHQHIAVERLGVAMSPLKARLFDHIRRAGDAGVSVHELVDDLWRGKISRNCASQHVKQLDDLLAETSFEIATEGRSRRARRYLRRRWRRRAA